MKLFGFWNKILNHRDFPKFFSSPTKLREFIRKDTKELKKNFFEKDRNLSSDKEIFFFFYWEE